ARRAARAAGRSPRAAGGAPPVIPAGRPADRHLRADNRAGGRGNMRRVAVPLARASYDVVIGAGILVPAAMEFVLGRGGGSPMAIVSDEEVAPLYAAPLAAACRAGLGEAAVATMTLPPGEASKSLAELGRLYGAFARAGLDRRSLVLA